MKPPISFKTADLIIQVIVILLSLYWLYFISKGDFDFMYPYVFVGGIQVVSCLLNRFMVKPEFRSRTRIVYELLLLAVVSFGVLNVIVDITMGFYVFMMMFSPVMALWYLLITGAELRKVHYASSGWRDNNDIDVRADA